MNQERIGKIIKKIREDNHQTQKEFASMYHVSFQAVSKWENGKNIPDLLLLKQICKDNNISIDELLENEKSKKKSPKIFLICIAIPLICMIIFGLIFILFFNKDDEFEFKKISTTCSTFKITGSIAYSKDKSSIYISNIEFCGEDENIRYKKIEYTLFESHDDVNIKVSSGNIQNNLTLIEYLKGLSIHVDDYSQTCHSFSLSQFYIEISATDSSDKITTYKIPISLEENCE